ncbi:MAG: hypothetical protein E5V25_00275 [Mesorhizobium sp.]|nr:MAG: hypothetical protein E5V25_00275 [Mesorhizobium sp.]TIX85960.1 MAG: hypothetical protein E5V27_00450 [Mesorhizobium sp.]TIX96553.1 MAG: hypothetical protein E5V24_00395 [Mesorhizobium sp.]
MSIRIEPGKRGEDRHELASQQLLATGDFTRLLCLTKAEQWLFARSNARVIGLTQKTAHNAPQEDSAHRP